MNSLFDTAVDYLRRGYPIFPCYMPTPEDVEEVRRAKGDAAADKFIKDNAKIPKVKWTKYQQRQATETEVRKWFTNCDPKRTAIGIATGRISGVSVVDVDSFGLLPMIKERGIGSPLVSRTGRGIQLIYSYDPRLPSTTNFKGIEKLDTRNDGAYIIAPPSRHYIGTAYRFLNDTDSLELSPPPEWLFEPTNEKKPSKVFKSAEPVDLGRLHSALAAIPADDYDTWFRVGMALKNTLGDDGLEIWREWSATSEKYDPTEINGKWDGFRSEHPNPVTIGTIYHAAAENGWADAPNTCRSKPGASIGINSTSTVDFICAADVDPKPVKWIWPGWLAAGKFHILAGQPGTGKTTIAYNLAATITTGGSWPDKTKCNEPGTIMIWSGEDAVDDTIVPRLKAAGGDLSKIHIIRVVTAGGCKRPFNPSTDMPLLYPSMLELKPKLLIVDSIVSAVAGDSHKNTETRRGLQPLVDLGEEFGVAILGISHFTKGTAGRDPLERVTGSLAFGALARIVLAAAKMPPGGKSGHDRIFARVKSNIGHDGNGFGYSLAETKAESIETVAVKWEGFVNGNAKDLLTESGDNSALNEAKHFLRQMLADGPKPAAEVKTAAKEAGVSGATLDRAKTTLHITSGKNDFKGGWVWALPPT